MKLHKILIALFSAAVISSCTNGFEDMNRDPLAVNEISPDLSLPNMQYHGFHKLSKSSLALFIPVLPIYVQYKFFFYIRQLCLQHLMGRTWTMDSLLSTNGKENPGNRTYSGKSSGIRRHVSDYAHKFSYQHHTYDRHIRRYSLFQSRKR